MRCSVLSSLCETETSPLPSRTPVLLPLPCAGDAFPRNRPSLLPWLVTGNGDSSLAGSAPQNPPSLSTDARLGAARAVSQPVPCLFWKSCISGCQGPWKSLCCRQTGWVLGQCWLPQQGHLNCSCLCCQCRIRQDTSSHLLGL